MARKTRGSAASGTRQRGDTRERLVDAAERLFAAKGFHGASLRDIGGAVGVSNAALLYHFPSKGKLYGAVLERIARSIEAAADRSERVADDELERLRRLYDTFFDWALDNPDYLRVIMREIMDNVGRVEKVERWYLRDVMDRLGELIVRGQLVGRFRPCDPQLFLYHMLGSISYFVLGHPTFGRVMRRDPREAVERFRRETFEHLRRALLVE